MGNHTKNPKGSSFGSKPARGGSSKPGSTDAMHKAGRTHSTPSDALNAKLERGNGSGKNGK